MLSKAIHPSGQGELGGWIPTMAQREMLCSGALSIENNQYDILGWMEGLNIKKARRYESFCRVARAL